MNTGTILDYLSANMVGEASPALQGHGLIVVERRGET